MDGLVGYLLGFDGWTPYVVILGVLVACGLGIPVPEDITLAAAGLLSYYGKANVWGMVGIGLLGVLAGDSMIFFLGRRYGRRIASYPPFNRLLTEKNLKKVEEQFKTRGTPLLFVARFMPGLRAPIYFSAGTLRIPPRTFLTYDGLAALLSVPAIVYGAYRLGDRFERFVEVVRSFEYGILAVVGLIVLFMVAKWAWARRRSENK